MSQPTVGRLVHYRLTRGDAKAINRRRADGVTNMGIHRANANGVVVNVGNQHHVGDVVPLLIVRVWPDEFLHPVAPDYQAGDESPEFFEPLSSYGVNGQAFLDGNDSLWISSAPNVDAPGGWVWPEMNERPATRNDLLQSARTACACN